MASTRNTASLQIYIHLVERRRQKEKGSGNKKRGVAYMKRGVVHKKRVF